MKSFLGWLMLLVALAVPAVLFYNWWTQMQAPTALEAAQEVPAGAGLSSVRASPSGAPSGGAPTVPGSSAGGRASSPAHAAVTSSGGAAPQVQKASTVPAADTQTKAAKKPRRRGRKELRYAPKTDRDPTLSILDMKLIALREEARRRALAPAPVQKKERKRVKALHTQIELQGIISTPQGRGAIINDEIYYRGDKVLGATIRKITSSTVIFRYKGRTFYKKM